MLADEDIRRVAHEAAEPLARHTLEHADLLIIALSAMIALTALLLPNASGGLEPGSRTRALIGPVVTRAAVAVFAVLVLVLGLLLVT